MNAAHHGTLQPTEHDPTLPAAVLPEDPVAFIARAEQATNTCDTDWPMTIYAPTIRLETIGDGVHDIHHGADAVRPALETIYEWFADVDAHITKTLIATSHDTVVNTWHGTLFGGRQTTYGAELWRFDPTGHVTHNTLYTAMNPKPPSHPITGMRMLIGHPRPSLAFLNLRIRKALRAD